MDAKLSTMPATRPKAMGFVRFDTALGECAIAWSDRAVVGVELPASGRSRVGTRLLRRHPKAREAAADSPACRTPVAAITGLLAGGRRNLHEVELDLRGIAEFDRRVYAAAREILPGSTLAYGDLAERAGFADAAREVGAAMARNPFPIVVPCHRVVAAGGRLGGFSAPGGAETKQRLLALEGHHHASPELTLFGAAR
jgi:methylated-DNA-[protein]-cysteine S-methyltransferase